MIYNLGSINADIFYDVPHIPQPGETLAATGVRRGLGGKGANQSVAIVRAGGAVKHIGAVGRDGQWMVDRMLALGVDMELTQLTDGESGHAIITVAADGENAITLMGGANQTLSNLHIQQSLSDVAAGDWLVLQNETNGQDLACELMRSVGGRVAYSAAPFDVDALKPLLGFLDVLAVNQGEASALISALNLNDIQDLSVPFIVVTKGAGGADLYNTQNGKTYSVSGFSVHPVDTTGAGDTFFGFFISALSRNIDTKIALNLANKAAALKVTRAGTADAIPTLSQVKAFQA